MHLLTKSEKCEPLFPTNWTKGLFCKIGLYYLKYPFLLLCPFNPVKKTSALNASKIRPAIEQCPDIFSAFFTLEMMFTRTYSILSRL
jgi:hypothetical protein